MVYCTISFFSIAFKAHISPVSLCFTQYTFPNFPFPSILPISKSCKDIFLNLSTSLPARMLDRLPIPGLGFLTANEPDVKPETESDPFGLLFLRRVLVFG